MADFSYIAQPQVPDSFRRIGEIVQTARGMTALQKERATLQADIEQRRAESSSAGSAATLARETLQPKIEREGAQTRSAVTGANLAQWKMDAEQAGKAYEIAGGLAQDPAINKGDSAGSVQALMRAEEMMRSLKIPEDKIRVQMAPLYGAAGHNPGSLRQMLDNIIRSGSGASAQASVANAPVTPVQTPQGAIAPLQLQPGAPGGVQPVPISSLQAPQETGAQPPAGVIPGGVPPAQRQAVSANPITGNPQVEEKDASGNVIAVRPAPVQGSVPQLNPGDREAIPELDKLRTKINQQASRVPESKFNNEQIIKLAEGTNLGRGSQAIANLRGQYAALPWTNDSASNYNLLGHHIARESVNMATAMGANTDSSRQLAEDANVSTGWTAGAVKSAAKVNNALVTGLENFNKGMEKAVAANGGNVLAVRDFQNAWSGSFDPNVYRYANALKSGDKAEITKILGPEGSPARAAKARELAAKSAVLHRLSTEGR